MESVSHSKQEHQAVGKSRRKQVKRSGHAKWKPAKRSRDALAILREAEQDRMPHLLSLKYERMAASPFGYFRGAVPVMAFDLGREPHTGVLTQLCGDAHVRNLGAFAGPDGRLVFDLNDFDETLRGPFEWDVKRMAASIHVAARETGESEADCREAVRVFLHRYSKAMALFVAMPVVEIARYQVHRGLEMKALGDVFQRAERETPLRLRDALTEAAQPRKKARRAADDAAQHAKPPRHGQGKHGGGEPDAAPRVFRSDPPLLVRLAKADAAPVLDALEPYLKTIQPERRHLLSRYRSIDVAFKVVGTGSVGLRNYVIYMEGNGPNDPLFLQMKQEVASAWKPYDGNEHGTAQAATSHGQRVVHGQRAMQVQSDPFLGWTHLQGRDFLVRQLNDHKGSVNLGTLDAASLAHYADLCGELLARGHARAGNPDELGGYLGRGGYFRKAIADFARRYADQTERDWKALQQHRKG